MDEHMKRSIVSSIEGFSLPRYHEIPSVGLYLDQTAKYIAEYLSCLGDYALTGSMISNYVKKGLVSNPVRKLYSREQIAYLLFIAVAKSVLSMDDLRLFIRLQQRTYTTEVAYDYFCSEFENVLQYVFGIKDRLDTVGVDSTDEKHMLRNTIITVAHKIYLEKCFTQMHSEQA